jgi:hypothetical protein
VDRQTGDRQTGDRQTGDRRTGDRKKVGRKTGDRETGDKKTKFVKKTIFCPKTFIEFIEIIEGLSIKKLASIKLAKILT